MTAVTPARRTPPCPAPAGAVPPNRPAAGRGYGRWPASRSARRCCSPSRRCVLSDFRLDLLAKYLCLAMVAVGIGLAWGRGGMLTLGQGVFFGLGGYAMAMHLKLADAGPGGDARLHAAVRATRRPAACGGGRSPARGSRCPATVLLPMAVAFAARARWCSGGGCAARTSRSSVQALAAASSILLIGQQGTTGGTNGLTDIQGFFGYDLDDPVNQRMVYFIIAAGRCWCCSRWPVQLIHSRYGELLVAVRDGEERVRFLGYDPALGQARRVRGRRRHGAARPGRCSCRRRASSRPR